jgi:hypothetical protein
MKFQIAIALVLIVHLSPAQEFSSDVYHDGYIVTAQQDTLKGSIKYDLEANMLSVLIDDKIKSYSSQKVFYFEIYDRVVKTYRQFYSVPYKVNYDYKIPIFFELIYEGKLSLLSREAIVQQTVTSSSPYWVASPTTQYVIEYSYYFLKSDGEITYFSGKKKDLFYIFPKKYPDLKKFIKDNKLDVDERPDLVRIVAFYNSI